MNGAKTVPSPADELRAHLRRAGEYHLHYDGEVWRLVRTEDSWKCRNDPQCCVRIPYTEEA